MTPILYIAFTVVVAILVLACGYLLVKYQQSRVEIADLIKQTAEANAQLGKLVSHDEYNLIMREAGGYKIRLEESQKNFEKTEAQLRGEIEVIKNERDALHRENTLGKQIIAKIEAEKSGLDERIKENRAEFEKLQEQFKMQFENLANKIFEEKTGKFKIDSEKSIGDLVKPLKEQLEGFKKTISDSFNDQTKEQISLKEQIKNIVQAHEKMTFQTESLTKALKGDSKAQGNWGEIILEKILEDSGLRKGVEYIVQGAEMGLKNDEDGRAQRPDVIIKLAEGSHIIIDSKVSLTHYERYCASEAEEDKAANMKLFINSMYSHVDNLASKKYSENQNLRTPDFVLMFMPIEGAYSLAIQKDVELHSYAWNKKIAIVCPSTLFVTLRTIASLWRIERQNQNANEIAHEGGKLYDKIVSFVDDLKQLGSQIEKSGKTYDELFKKLSTGKDNILRKTEKMRTLGAKTAKSLPKELLDEMDNIENDTELKQIA